MLEGAERGLDLVAHAPDLEEQMRRAGLQQDPADPADHAQRLGACSGRGCASSRNKIFTFTMCWTWALSARPSPTMASLTSAGSRGSVVPVGESGDLGLGTGHRRTPNNPEFPSDSGP